jgi:hypothetical protein
MSIYIWALFCGILKHNHITIVRKDTVKTETLMVVQKVFHTIVFTYKRSYHAMNFRSCVARKALNFLTTLVRFFRRLEALSESSSLNKFSEVILHNHFTMSRRLLFFPNGKWSTKSVDEIHHCLLALLLHC